MCNEIPLEFPFGQTCVVLPREHFRGYIRFGKEEESSDSKILKYRDLCVVQIKEKYYCIKRF